MLLRLRTDFLADGAQFVEALLVGLENQPRFVFGALVGVFVGLKRRVSRFDLASRFQFSLLQFCNPGVESVERLGPVTEFILSLRARSFDLFVGFLLFQESPLNLAQLLRLFGFLVP